MVKSTNAIVPAEDKTIQLSPDTVSVSRLVKKTIFNLEPVEYERLKFLAEAYAVSSFNPKDNNNKPQRSQADYLLIMLKGMELGFEPMAAVSMISIIKGQPTLDGKGMLAIIHASGMLEDIQIKGDAESCTVTMMRKGYRSAFQATFSMKDAESMGLLNKDGSNYKKQPKTMLKWRAVAACAREAFPDLLGGLYTQEELAPEHVQVLDDGSMQYAAPQLPAQASSPSTQNVDEWLDKPKDDGDKWLADVREFCTSFYSHVNHRNNSIEFALSEGYIQRTMTPLKAAALMMHHCATKPISDGGLELSDAEIAEALNGRLSDYMSIEGHTWGSAWDTLKRYDLRKAQESQEQDQSEEFDDMPL